MSNQHAPAEARDSGNSNWKTEDGLINMNMAFGRHGASNWKTEESKGSSIDKDKENQQQQNDDLSLGHAGGLGFTTGASRAKVHCNDLSHEGPVAQFRDTLT